MVAISCRRLAVAQARVAFRCCPRRRSPMASEARMARNKLVFTLVVLLAALTPGAAQDNAPVTLTVTTIASGLRNPRGVAFFPDGRMLVAEAGDASNVRENQGRLSVFDDANGDGDYDDEGERTAVMCCVRGYNALTNYGTGLDEVGGLGDV